MGSAELAAIGRELISRKPVCKPMTVLTVVVGPDRITFATGLRGLGWIVAWVAFLGNHIKVVGGLDSCAH